MTTHKPEVVAYLATWKDGVIHTYNPPVITSDSIERSEPLIRLSDYEALQAECEQLRAILSCVASAVGAHAETGCSVEFLAGIPREVELALGGLRKDAEAVRKLDENVSKIPDSWRVCATLETDEGWSQMVFNARMFIAHKFVSALANHIDDTLQGDDREDDGEEQ